MQSEPEYPDADTGQDTNTDDAERLQARVTSDAEEQFGGRCGGLRSCLSNGKAKTPSRSWNACLRTAAR